MWFEESVFYQFYSLGFCGALGVNEDVPTPRIMDAIQWIPHLMKLHVNAIYFTPIFQSSSHGYDTCDYRLVDNRLGSNDDFKTVVKECHAHGIKVVLDGVFNHVGRDFWAFKDVLTHAHNSQYRDWFFINYEGNSNYNDGFYYEGWEGHYELVKLNLKNPDVLSHLFDCTRRWIEEFDIDGIRLDVAYSLDPGFMKTLRSNCLQCKPDFFLVGEILSGDYKRIVNDDMLNSCTNYECFKGIYSSLNDYNLFEIAHSLKRQFSDDPYALYKGMNLFSFVDNHDVSRLASNLKKSEHCLIAYLLLLTIPGIPCIYYGSEWQLEGVKQKGSDANLRPHIENPVWTEFTSQLSKLIQIHRNTKALTHGNFKSVLIANRQFIFQRQFEDECCLVVMNIDENDYLVPQTIFGPNASAFDCVANEDISLSDHIILPPSSFKILKVVN